MNFLHQKNKKSLNEEDLDLQKAIEESLKSDSFDKNIRQAKAEYHNKILKLMANIDNSESFNQKLGLVNINCTNDFQNLKKASLTNIEQVIKNIEHKDILFKINLLRPKSDEKEEIYGIDKTMHGLTQKDIQINLADIVKTNLQTDFYIAPSIMEQKELLISLNEWQNMRDGSVSLYAALVKVTNQTDVKHAILLSAQQTGEKVQITITEPLAKEDSTFGIQLNELHNALEAQGFYDVAINYAGTQDKNYGICADMSLIMLQGLIEQAANKPILETRKQTIVDNFDNNHIDYDNAQLHNFDYDNYHPALLGQDHNETI